MYSDRVEEVGKRSVKERLKGSVFDDSVRRRPVAGKRQRQDDKWEHDLFEDRPQVSRSKAPRLGVNDLRLKLHKKSTHQLPRGGGTGDLREKLSGLMHTQPLNADTSNPIPLPEAIKPTTRRATAEAPVSEPRKVASAVIKKSREKGDASVDGFLQSLGLEKYRIQFQAEEVDMAALEQLTDEDLRAMGIPMVELQKVGISQGLSSASLVRGLISHNLLVFRDRGSVCRHPTLLIPCY